MKHAPERGLRVVRMVFALGITSTACALLGWAFLRSLTWAEHLRTWQPWLFWCLPVAGLGFAWASERIPASWRVGTAGVLTLAREGKTVSTFAGAFAFLGTVWTHIFGGSAGREGTAVQLGASIGAQSARSVGVAEPDLVAAGIAAGFAAVFGTPLAASMFAFEVGGKRPSRTRSVAVVMAAFGADRLSRKLGAPHVEYTITPFAFETLHAWLGAAAMMGVCALTARAFLEALWGSARLFQHVPARLRLAAGGLATVTLGKALGTTAYNGLGLTEIRAAFERPVDLDAALWKGLMTVFTVASGFVGGEVTPLFYIGSHVGSSLAPSLGLGVNVAAALGLACLFPVAANVPATGMCLALELFGPSYVLPCGLICLGAAHLKGARGLYPNLPGRKPYFWVV